MSSREELARRSGTIAQAYEFMLAYAAQGLAGDAASQAGGQMRELLTGAAAAVSGLAEGYAALVEAERLQPHDRYAAFLPVLARDAAHTLAAFELVLAQPSIPSQVVDNLNASMHVRALLTDLFLLDEVLKNGHP